jgi:hypothetical protein
MGHQHGAAASSGARELLHSEARRYAVPIHAIARALDIVDIREEPLRSIEGALIMRPDRDVGAILANANSSRQRRRYTVAHELGHFLNLWHQPANEGGFACTTEDLGTPWGGVSRDAGRHRLQESQANRFAIELLAPATRVKPLLKGIPDLEQVIAVSADLDISKEAAAPICRTMRAAHRRRLRAR